MWHRRLGNHLDCQPDADLASGLEFEANANVRQDGVRVLKKRDLIYVKLRGSVSVFVFTKLHLAQSSNKVTSLLD